MSNPYQIELIINYYGIDWYLKMKSKNYSKLIWGTIMNYIVQWIILISNCHMNNSKF